MVTIHFKEYPEDYYFTITWRLGIRYCFLPPLGKLKRRTLFAETFWGSWNFFYSPEVWSPGDWKANIPVALNSFVQWGTFCLRAELKLQNILGKVIDFLICCCQDLLAIGNPSPNTRCTSSDLLPHPGGGICRSDTRVVLTVDENSPLAKRSWGFFSIGSRATTQTSFFWVPGSCIMITPRTSFPRTPFLWPAILSFLKRPGRRFPRTPLPPDLFPQLLFASNL